MKPNKTPWEYIQTTFEVTEGETYNGYDKKYNPPLKYISHKILSKGNAVVIESTHFAESTLNKKDEVNFLLIAQAVNRFIEELER